jgi:hypothetical protein
VTRGTRTARLAQLALLLAGAVLLAALVRRIGATQLLADLRGFGWAFAGVVALELVIDVCNTVAWRRTLPPGTPVEFALLFWIRQAGVAINLLTPTATVGGEVVKTVLLRPRLPTPATAASLVAARMSYAFAQAALVLAGLVAVLGRLREAPDLAIAVVAVFLAIVSGVVTFVWLQRRGIFTALVAGAGRLGVLGRFLERAQGGSAALDAQLAALYSERPGAFVLSVLWHCAGQFVGLVQLAYILAALGVPTPLATCLAMEAFALVLDSAAFLVPGRLGVQEAGRVLVFTTFGLAASTALAAAVIVRLNQLTVSMIGLTALGYFTLVPVGSRAATPPGRRAPAP